MVISAYNFLQHYEENHAVKDMVDAKETEEFSGVATKSGGTFGGALVNCS